MKKIILILSLFIVVIGCQNKDETPSTIYVNGDIITMETNAPVYTEAVVEQNGKIVFVGTKEDAEKQYANLTEVDLQGKTMLPGFIDPHSHFEKISNTKGQLDLNPPPVGDITNIAQILEKWTKAWTVSRWGATRK